MLGLLLLAAAFVFAPSLSSAHEVVDSGPPPGVGDPLPKGAVARVAPGLIRTPSYRHWFRITVALAGRKKPPKEGTRAHTRLRKDTMRFLITARWVVLEAPEHGVKVSKGEVTKALKKSKRQSFPNERAYRAYLKRSKQTDKDIRFRIRLNLLTNKLQDHVTAGTSTRAEAEDALNRFVAAFNRKWRARTACAAKYATSQCSHVAPAA